MESTSLAVLRKNLIMSRISLRSQPLSELGDSEFSTCIGSFEDGFEPRIPLPSPDHYLYKSSGSFRSSLTSMPRHFGSVWN